MSSGYGFQLRSACGRLVSCVVAGGALCAATLGTPAGAGAIAQPCFNDGVDQALIESSCSVSGVKFEDLNSDGVLNPEEPGLAGWTIFADFDGNAQPDAGEPSAVTDSSGSYTLSFVGQQTAESFAAREVAQPGWTCTHPAVSCSYSEQPFLGEGSSGDFQRSERNFGNHQVAQVQAPAPSQASGAATRKISTGTASMRGPGGCALKSFRVSVQGNSIANVSYYLDGRKLMTVIAPDRKGRFSQRINAQKLEPGAHRIRADIVFAAASATSSRKLARTFQRCKAAKAKPKFTG